MNNAPHLQRNNRGSRELSEDRALAADWQPIDPSESSSADTSRHLYEAGTSILLYNILLS